MKIPKIVFLLAAITGSSAYAECAISGSQSAELNTILAENKGWSFDGYDALCHKLEKANAGVNVEQSVQYSDTQITISTRVTLYPLEVAEKYNFKLLTRQSYSLLGYTHERTSNAERHERYRNANAALNALSTSENPMDTQLKELAIIRGIVKP